MKLLEKIMGDPNKKILKRLYKKAEEVNGFEEKIQALSDEELLKKTAEFKERIGDTSKLSQEGLQKKLDALLPEAFAVVREAAKRTLQQRHFDVQLIGAMVLHERGIAEMRTGEGKTLTSTAVVYLNALAGKGAHIVTVNDYLARRDTAWMGQVYNFLGLSVGCIQNQGGAFLYDSTAVADEQDSEEDEVKSFKVDIDNLRPCERTEAYQADVTYGTNNEFGFDYLRDNMVGELSQRVQRELHFAIIDEVDSILIDEARTPLIISAPDEESTQKYKQFAQIVKQLQPEKDYVIDEKLRAAALSEEGIKKAEEKLGVANIYTEDVTLAFHLEQALKAEAVFQKDKDYVVKDGEVMIVDEFTGRLMPGRRYSQGLHQAIEAKENLEVQRENRTLATITIQNYFRMYSKLSGMTGTAKTEEEEFIKIYGLEVVQVPTNKPIQRNDLRDVIYKNETGKMQALVKDVRERQKKGQPVLIGTISIEKNEGMSEVLTKAGIDHNILNAKNHEREAEYIAQAGKVGSVTVATNMAGRGVDIVLGGAPLNEQEYEKVKKLGGLYVLGSERHEARRIDNQLRGRSGRQGDPGESRFYISMDDDLLRIFGTDRIKGLMNAMKMPDDMPIENKMVNRSIETAQKKVEGHNFDTRKHLLQYDDILNHQRQSVYNMRNEVLEVAEEKHEGRTLRDMIMEMVQEESAAVVELHTMEGRAPEWNTKEITDVVETMHPLSDDSKKELDVVKTKGSAEEAREKMTTLLMDQATEVYDGIDELYAEDPDSLKQNEKSVLLRTIDMHWMDHLDAVEHIRAGIGLRGYGQRDPLVEYKRETHRLYKELLNLIRSQVAFSVFKIARDVNSVIEQSPLLKQFQNVQFSAPAKSADSRKSAISTSAAQAQGESSSSASVTQEKAYPKAGRNDPCPCGSGKKYKKCHGA